MTKKEILEQRIYDLTGVNIKGETDDSIIFYNKEQQVGESKLPPFTQAIHRHILADILDIKEYDNFCIVRKDKTLVWAHHISVEGLTGFLSHMDFKGTYAELDKMQYQEYLKNQKNPRCSCCGKAW